MATNSEQPGAAARPGFAARGAGRLLAHLLARNGWAAPRLAPFAGRQVVIALGTVKLGFVVGAEGMLTASPIPDAPDVQIELPADALKHLPDGVDALFRQARISGDAHFAETLGFVLRHLEWDVEEDLTRVLGDPLAHRVHQSWAGILAWGRQAAQNTAQNVQEFTVEEARLVPSGTELAEFGHDIAELRDALARLTKRLERLERSSS